MPHIPPEDLALLLPAGRVEPPEHAVFRLARYIRHNLGLLLQGERPAVYAVVREWMAAAAPRWEAGALDEGDILYQLEMYWDEVKTAVGCDPIHDAARRALADPTFPRAPWRYPATHAAVFRVFHWLNVWAFKTRQPSYFASSHAIAAALGAQQTMVHRAIHRMIADGHLIIAERGTKTRATRYAIRNDYDPSAPSN